MDHLVIGLQQALFCHELFFKQLLARRKSVYSIFDVHYPGL